MDMGSGNGYWTYMLRRQEQGKKKLNVIPVDSGMSEWRTMWVPDTAEMDGVKWLYQHAGAKDDVLLLVYPNTGEEFTSKTIKAYRTLNSERCDEWPSRQLICFYRWDNDHCSQLTECIRVYCFCKGDNRRMDGERVARLGENTTGATPKFRRQRRGALRLRKVAKRRRREITQEETKLKRETLGRIATLHWRSRSALLGTLL